MDCSPPGSSIHGILQARILQWVAKPSSITDSMDMSLSKLWEFVMDREAWISTCQSLYQHLSANISATLNNLISARLAA